MFHYIYKLFYKTKKLTIEEITAKRIRRVNPI